MKKSFRLLSILLSLCLMLAVVPLGTFTASAATSGTCGENLTWEYDNDTCTLTISGAGAMSDYSGADGLDAPWKFNDTINDTMKTVNIGNGVTTIGYEAFEYCTGLTSVTIPDSVTTIGDWAFYRCTGLTNITIPDSVTTIGRSAFAWCEGLTSVTIPDSVTFIDSDAFYNTAWHNKLCNNQPNGMIYIGKVAYKYNGTCPSTVVLRNDTVGIAGSAFSGCTGLTSITIPNSVTTIGYDAFAGCTGLTSITIPNSVTTIGYDAFAGCKSLTSITIPASVTSIGWDAFRGCPVTFYGLAGSEAERYAAARSIPFVAMPEMIEIFTLPKTEYEQNEAFDPYHLIIMVYYSDGTAQLRYRGYDVSGFDSSKVGTQTVTVSYLGAKTSF